MAYSFYADYTVMVVTGIQHWLLIVRENKYLWEGKKLQCGFYVILYFNYSICTMCVSENSYGQKVKNCG